MLLKLIKLCKLMGAQLHNLLQRKYALRFLSLIRPGTPGATEKQQQGLFGMIIKLRSDLAGWSATHPNTEENANTPLQGGEVCRSHSETTLGHSRTLINFGFANSDSVCQSCGTPLDVDMAKENTWDFDLATYVNESHAPKGSAGGQGGVHTVVAEDVEEDIEAWHLMDPLLQKVSFEVEWLNTEVVRNQSFLNREHADLTEQDMAGMRELGVLSLKHDAKDGLSYGQHLVTNAKKVRLLCRTIFHNISPF